MAGSVSATLFATFAVYTLQLTHNYTILFAISASAYLTAFLILVLLVPGLKKVELVA
jgi:hypothetical protein